VNFGFGRNWSGIPLAVRRRRLDGVGRKGVAIGLPARRAHHPRDPSTVIITRFDGSRVTVCNCSRAGSFRERGPVLCEGSSP